MIIFFEHITHKFFYHELKKRPDISSKTSLPFAHIVENDKA